MEKGDWKFFAVVLAGPSQLGDPWRSTAANGSCGLIGRRAGFSPPVFPKAWRAEARPTRGGNKKAFWLTYAMGLALAAAMGVMLSAGFAIAADGADGTPLVKPLVDSSPIDDVLDVLDARGQGLKTFSANVDMTKTDTSDQSSTEQTGRVVFENTPEGASRARITFDGIIINDMMDKKAKNEYILDGSWLTELDYKPQKIIRRQVLKPGEKINLLKLGEGPFPLPIGQDKSAVHGEFDVKKIDLTKDDPKRTVHIELIPKPGTQFARQFATIDVFVDETTGMPDRIVTLDRNQTVSQQTDLSDIKLNSALPNNAFDVPGETAGWAVVEEPYTR